MTDEEILTMLARMAANNNRVAVGMAMHNQGFLAIARALTARAAGARYVEPEPDETARAAAADFLKKAAQ
jgi:isopropylmalate/homocitrate/citramalate synthase